eukprot:m.71956 g.71956  ORF g.71956 m.71956 type:complete len:107 (+) comp14230_c0_seq7:49-369(+)
MANPSSPEVNTFTVRLRDVGHANQSKAARNRPRARRPSPSTIQQARKQWSAWSEGCSARIHQLSKRERVVLTLTVIEAITITFLQIPQRAIAVRPCCSTPSTHHTT